MKPIRLAVAALCLAALAACGSAAPADLAAADTADATPIVGGAPTTAYPAVGMLFNAHSATDLSGSICTATVIAPHTLLTAAHCVLAPRPDGKGELPQVVTPDHLYYTPQANTATIDPSTLIAVTDVEVPQTIDLNRFVTTLSGGRFNTDDIAIVHLATAAPAVAQPLLQRALSNADVGTKVTLIGYGSTGAASYSGPRQRRATQAAIGGINSALVGTSNGGRGVCTGDSGGPMLLGTSLIAITQGGRIDPTTGACAGNDVFTRLDVWADFIAAGIAADNG